MNELLLRRAQAGDPRAFEQLITPLESMIWRVCWHFTGNRRDASDCGQEAMLKIWRSLKDYRRDSSLESWCYRVAANTCLDFLRKKKRTAADSLEAMKETGFDPADEAPGTEETVLRQEEHRQLRQAIAALPEEQRDALVLTQLEGLPYEQVAATLGVEPGTVKSRVNRAKQKLKEILSETREPNPDRNVNYNERRHLR